MASSDQSTPAVNNGKAQGQQTKLPSASPKRRLLPPSSLLSTLIRGVSAVLAFIVVALACYFTIPFRAFHNIMKSWGLGSYLPTDMAQRYGSRLIVFCAGINVQVEQAHRMNAYLDTPVIYLFTHGSMFDPLFLLAYCPSIPKFLFKKELITHLPPVGVLVWAIGHIPINRGRREEAIQSIESAKEKILHNQRSIAISPEGRRTTTGMKSAEDEKKLEMFSLMSLGLRSSCTGELCEFKKGPFHLAHAVAKPMVPVIIRNGFTMWPPGQLFSDAGDVVMRIGEPLNPGQLEVEELLKVSREAIVKEMDMVSLKEGSRSADKRTLRSLLMLPLLMVALYAECAFVKLLFVMIRSLLPI